METLLVWQLISIVSLIIGVYLFGFAPLLLGNSISKGHVSLLSAFSGGVLIGTTFIHLFPEVLYIVVVYPLFNEMTNKKLRALK